MAEASIVSVEHLPSAIVIHVLAAELRKQSEVEAICGAIDAARPAALALPFILDMSKVVFMGSLAMGVLIGLNNEFISRKQRLIFASLQRNVLQAIQVTHMNKMMEIVPDLETAKKNTKS
jgi:anti-anti-sigma factor